MHIIKVAYFVCIFLAPSMWMWVFQLQFFLERPEKFSVPGILFILWGVECTLGLEALMHQECITQYHKLISSNVGFAHLAYPVKTILQNEQLLIRYSSILAIS